MAGTTAGTTDSRTQSDAAAQIDDAEVVAEGLSLTDELTTETAPEDLTQTAPQPVPAVARGGAGGMIIGGVLSAAIGAAAALAILPEGWRHASASATAALESRLAALESRPGGIGATDLSAAIATVDSRLNALESAPAEALAGRISALESAPVPDIAPLEARLSALEATPGGLDQQALAAALAPMESRLAQMGEDIAAQARSAVDDALAQARAVVAQQADALTGREEDVAAAQARVAARSALASLIAAADSGDPAPDALAALPDAPAALAPLADGLVTQAQLIDRFAPAARAALAAVPPPTDASALDRALGFLRSQTGARSLAPRTGNDADAVLSRAEAALRAGDLRATLAEIDALTGAPAAALADWRAQAAGRLAVLDALADAEAHMNRDGE